MMRQSGLALVLVVVFLFGFVNAHFFVHPHQIDGVYVFHSHPFKKQASSDRGVPVSHQHSTNGCVLVQALDKTTFNAPIEVPRIEQLYVVVAVDYVQAEVSWGLPIYRGVSLWRAPPVC